MTPLGIVPVDDSSHIAPAPAVILQNGQQYGYYDYDGPSPNNGYSSHGYGPSGPTIIQVQALPLQPNQTNADVPRFDDGRNDTSIETGYDDRIGHGVPIYVDASYVQVQSSHVTRPEPEQRFVNP